MNTKIEIEEAESAYIVRLERGRQSESDDVEYLYLTPREAGPKAPRDSSRAADPRPPRAETRALPPPVTAAPPPSQSSCQPSGQPSGKPQYEGFTVSHYQVERAIGRGGMGDVYLARDLRLGRPVALKLLRADYHPTEERVRRFQQEARAVCALNHPNIVTVYEIGEVDGAPFIVSEFIEGDTLRQLIPPSGMRLDQALEIAIQIANALAFAHQLGIVHRDIKPENVMVRSDGYVKVLDFGLAKLSDALDDRDAQDPSFNAGMVMGTITYMSPEQARGYKVDARTDIFSLGATLYELVTGVKPFTGRTPTEILSA
ncbi:MAG: serine/threonine-protein kinase, partial [Blastocatellia bacterium]